MNMTEPGAAVPKVEPIYTEEVDIKAESRMDRLLGLRPHFLRALRKLGLLEQNGAWTRVKSDLTRTRISETIEVVKTGQVFTVVVSFLGRKQVMMIYKEGLADA